MVAGFSPEIRVEIAWTSGYKTPAADRTWYDMSDYVEAQEEIKIDRGRSDEFSEVQPSKLALTLDNTDGAFTPENAGSVFYPNVKKGRPIRVKFKWPAAFINMIDAVRGSLSTVDGLDLWSSDDLADFGEFPGLTRSADFATVGTHSLKTVFATNGAGNGIVFTDVPDLVVGRQYTVSLDARVPAGGKPIILLLPAGATSSASFTTAFDTWQRLSYTFTATAAHLPVGKLRVGFANGADTVGGEVAYVDGVTINEGAADLGYAGAAVTFSHRFTGYVDDWPVAWPDATDDRSTVDITASSRTARMGKAAELRSIVEEEVLADGPRAYYPLGEPSGATAVGNAATDRQDVMTIVQAGVGGTLEFGNGIGPDTDGLSAPVFTRAGVFDGLYLRTAFTNPLNDATDQSVAIEAWFVTTATEGTIASVHMPGFLTSFLRLEVTAAGKVRGYGWQGTGHVSALTGGATVTDGLLHHAVYRATKVGLGDSVWSLTVDGVILTSGPAFAGGTSVGDWTLLHVGSALNGAGGGWYLFDGTIAHVAVYGGDVEVSDFRFGEHRLAGVDGFESDSSDERIARYARLAGVPTDELDLDVGLSTSIAHIETTGLTPVALMRRVELTEQGMLFDGGDGSLAFHSRSRRYMSTPLFTLHGNTHELGSDFAPVLDDQQLLNDVTVSRVGGVIVRSTNETSRDEHGDYREQVELITTSDNEVLAFADWRVARYGEPKVRLSSVTVDAVLLAASWPSLFDDDLLGARFTVEDLPAQAPGPTLDLFIEGYAETITHERYDITFNTSNALNSQAWILDTSTLDTTTTLAY